MAAYDVIVIGSGIAGLTATKQLLKTDRSLSTANIEAETFGGLVMNINELDGKIQGSGMEFAAALMMESADLGAVTLSERVTAISGDANGWTVTTSEGSHQGRVVIVASGASLKRLGIPGEEEFEYKGISRCADCDGPMFAGKDVVVAGGGDSALQEAHVLASLCRHVTLINLGDKLTAQQHLVDAIKACPNLTIHHRTEVVAILGGTAVEKVRIRDLNGGTESEIPSSGFFGFIGLKPASDFAPASVKRDDKGRIVTDASFQAAPGLFAAGAVRAGCGGMLEHAIADGIASADGAIKLLRAKN